MGLTQSLISKATNYGLLQFNQKRWNKVGTVLKRSPSVSNLHIYKSYASEDIYESIDNGSMVEKYLLEHCLDVNLRDFLDTLKWRNGCQQVVHACMIGIDRQVHFCTSIGKIQLYTQYIPLRLTEINDIPFPENLYVLRQVLLGFEYLFKRHKRIQVKEKFICITKDCNVKVWMNSNLSAQYQQFSDGYNNLLITEHQIVNQIINTIANNTDHVFEPKDIREYLKQKQRRMTFKNILSSINQFASLLNVEIPSSLQSVNCLFESSSSQCNNWIPFTSQKKNLNINELNDYSTSEVKEVETTVQQEYIPLLDLSKTNYASSRISYQNSIYQQLQDKCFTERYNYQLSSNQKTFPLTPLTAREPTRHLPKVRINFINKFKKFDNESQKHFVKPNSLFQTINPNKTQNIKFKYSKRNQNKNYTKGSRCQQQFQEWKYFESDGWSYIDPTIAADLNKLISLQSKKK